jgi:hypothetical protein
MTQQNGGSKSYAWVLSEGAKAEYNPAFLQNGERVSLQTYPLVLQMNIAKHRLHRFLSFGMRAEMSWCISFLERADAGRLSR